MEDERAYVRARFLPTIVAAAPVRVVRLAASFGATTYASVAAPVACIGTEVVAAAA